MKYLATYRIFENKSEEILQDVNDICRDLWEDNNLDVNIDSDRFPFSLVIEIGRNFPKNPDSVLWSEVKDTLVRLNEYMSKEGFKSSFEYNIVKLSGHTWEAFPFNMRDMTRKRKFRVIFTKKRKRVKLDSQLL